MSCNHRQNEKTIQTTHPRNANANASPTPRVAEYNRLLAKAKAARAERIQSQRALEKSYVTTNNLKLDADTSKVQLAVYKLSKAGGLIDQGYLALAAEALSDGSWQEDLKGAEKTLGKDPKALLNDVAALQKACTGGDAAKVRTYGNIREY